MEMKPGELVREKGGAKQQRLMPTCLLAVGKYNSISF